MTKKEGRSFSEVLELPKKYLITIPKGKIEKEWRKRKEHKSFESLALSEIRSKSSNHNKPIPEVVFSSKRKRNHSTKLRAEYIDEQISNNNNNNNNNNAKASRNLGFFRRNFSNSIAHIIQDSSDWGSNQKTSTNADRNKTSQGVNEDTPFISTGTSPNSPHGPNSVAPTPPLSPNSKAMISPKSPKSTKSTELSKKKSIPQDDAEGNDLNVIPSKWLKISYRGSPPSPRYYHSSVIIENTLYIFGGKSSESIKNQIYTLDLDTYYWSRPQVIGNIPHRYGHTSVEYNNNMFTFGGIGTGEKILDDFYILTVNNNILTWVEIVPPNTVSEEVKSNIIQSPVMANQLPSSINSIYQLSPSKIVTTSDVWPPALAFHSSCVIDGVIYIIGGTDHTKYAQNNSIWRYHIYQKYWSTITISPSLNTCQMSTIFEKNRSENNENKLKEIIVVGGMVSKKSIKAPIISSINLNSQKITYLEFSYQETARIPKNKLSYKIDSLTKSEPNDSTNPQNKSIYLQRNQSFTSSNQKMSLASFKNFSTQFDRSKIKAMTQDITPPKTIHSHCSFYYENFCAIIGGLNEKNEISSEIFIYNLENSKWSTYNKEKYAPPPMYGHSCSKVNNKIIIFGGCTSGRDFSNDCYQLQLFPLSNNNNNNISKNIEIIEDDGKEMLFSEFLNMCDKEARKIKEQIDMVSIPKLRKSVVVVENHIHYIPKNELNYHQKLSKGATSTVYLGKYQDLSVAIKKYNRKEVMAFNSEVLVLKSSNHHPNIVNCYGIVDEEDEKSIVFEYAELGDLYSYMRKLIENQQKIDFPFILKIAINIAEGMKFLHDLDILHRDLKSLNILMISNNIEASVCVKIMDFGESRKRSHDLPGGDLGSIRWTAPEILKKEAFKDKSDVYSFGIILWELVSMQVPFEDCARDYLVEEKVLAGCRPEFPADFKCFAYKLLTTSCWHPSPLERPTFDEIIHYLAAIQNAI